MSLSGIIAQLMGIGLYVPGENPGPSSGTKHSQHPYDQLIRYGFDIRQTIWEPFTLSAWDDKLDNMSEEAQNWFVDKVRLLAVQKIEVKFVGNFPNTRILNKIATIPSLKTVHFVSRRRDDDDAGRMRDYNSDEFCRKIIDMYANAFSDGWKNFKISIGAHYFHRISFDDFGNPHAVIDAWNIFKERLMLMDENSENDLRIAMRIYEIVNHEVPAERRIPGLRTPRDDCQYIIARRFLKQKLKKDAEMELAIEDIKQLPPLMSNYVADFLKIPIDPKDFLKIVDYAANMAWNWKDGPGLKEERPFRDTFAPTSDPALYYEKMLGQVLSASINSASTSDQER